MFFDACFVQSSVKGEMIVLLLDKFVNLFSEMLLKTFHSVYERSADSNLCETSAYCGGGPTAEMLGVFMGDLRCKSAN